jgi:hypothetical protein
MDKARYSLMLGTVIVIVAIGLLVGRSQAQPEQLRRAGEPFFLKIGRLRLNPNQVSSLNTYMLGDPPYECLEIIYGGNRMQLLELGTDGVAESLLEWFDSHSTEIKPKPPKRK